ncbi:MAG: hypothetical protein Fur0046_39180 [Cyanobacteria bacterium J069]|nr:MAG: peptide chain release factor 1 [Cyanobacteria bacterium J069]
MSNPLRRIKQLPWLPLFQTAGYAIVGLFGVELVLWWSSSRLLFVAQANRLIFSPPLDLIIALSIAIGVGALAVHLLDRFQRTIFLNLGILWGLVACLIVMVWVRSLSGIPSLLPPSQEALMGLIIGVFWRGKNHWRW